MGFLDNVLTGLGDDAAGAERLHHPPRVIGRDGVFEFRAGQPRALALDAEDALAVLDADPHGGLSDGEVSLNHLASAGDLGAP